MKFRKLIALKMCKGNNLPAVPHRPAFKLQYSFFILWKMIPCTLPTHDNTKRDKWLAKRSQNARYLLKFNFQSAFVVPNEMLKVFKFLHQASLVACVVSAASVCSANSSACATLE